MKVVERASDSISLPKIKINNYNTNNENELDFSETENTETLAKHYSLNRLFSRCRNEGREHCLSITQGSRSVRLFHPDEKLRPGLELRYNRSSTRVQLTIRISHPLNKNKKYK
jgi:hypothetical protein